MDHWVKEKHRHGGENPSFSSTLLDAIYRSLDEEEELVLYKETSKKKQSTSTTTVPMRSSTKKLTKEEEEEDEMERFRRACMIENWMEKKVSEKVVFRRNSLPDFDRKTLLKERFSSKVFHSTSSSSDSSCGGVFSSSEAESCYGSRSRASSFTCQRPKPIRTNVYENKDRISNSNMYEQQQQQQSQINKSKWKAMKIYGELKKGKQPISPGARLASFLNNLFTSGHVKKSKISNSTSMNSVEERKSKSAQTSTCSSASSFSRSCLSKTPSTRSKPTMNGNGTVKRSVRFYPVSVIVDEDSRPCGHKSLLQEAETPKIIKLNDQLKFHIMEKNRRIEEAARDLLKNYQRKNDVEMRDSDDDAASDVSSDLFELDNLQRYREELPVYETTHLDKNRAIANGFFV